MLNGVTTSSISSLGSILIVDDEEHITTLLRDNLDYEGYHVDVETNASRAAAMDLSGYRLLLVDAMSQAFTGRDLLREVKKNPLTAYVPVIFVVHSDSEDNVVGAFADGVDDYILKPFSLRELLARVRSVLRRNPGVTRIASTTLRLSTLSVDLLARTVSDDGVLLPLTKTEYAILTLLLKDKGTFFNRRSIFAEVWAESNRADNDRIVDTNISRLRKKLGKLGAKIINKTGVGYAIVD